MKKTIFIIMSIFIILIIMIYLSIIFFRKEKRQNIDIPILLYHDFVLKVPEEDLRILIILILQKASKRILRLY